MFALYDRATRFALNLVNPYVHGDGASPATTVWPYLRAHLFPLRWVMILSLCMTTLAATVEVWLISYAGQLIDMLVVSTPGMIWQDHAPNLMFAAVMLIIVRPFIQFLRHAVNDIGLDCNGASLFRYRAHAHLTRQSVGWFQDDLAGRTASRLVLMGNYATAVIFQSLNAVAFGAVYMIGIVMFMAGTDVCLAIPLLLWVVIYAALMIWIVPRVVYAMETFMASKSALLGQVVDVFSNFDTVSLFAKPSEIEDNHTEALETTRQRLFEARQISVGLRTTTIWLEGLIIVGFVGCGIWFWSMGLATIGIVGTTIALSLRIATLAEWIMDAVGRIFEQVGSVREALGTLAQPLAISFDPNAPDLNLRAGAIEVKEIAHRYGKADGGIEDVSLSIKAGERIGLVGPSGAGKSTLVNLILRFYAPEDGQILIDGQDLATVSADSLRDNIGMVSQQAALLNRSVRDNIALGRQDVSQELIEHAARQAHAHDFILGLEDSKGRKGYDAHVGERGVKLSGGQRQRVALARVILKAAPIMILDEATSALDSTVEAEIQAALRDVMRGKTVISIAHRLSTIAELDRIIVMDQGRIVEQGSHDDLLAQDGLYATFWARQSGGVIGTTHNANEDTT
ncbi:MAG: ABC transporter ATP-binding protein [Planktomarina sp.]